MKVLVATTRTQGARSNDYNGCIDGELVWIQKPCSTDGSTQSATCWCGREFTGIVSQHATTTAAVRNIPGLTIPLYAEAILTGITDGGWPAEWASEIARKQAACAAEWADGAVIERDVEWLRERLRGRSRTSDGG